MAQGYILAVLFYSAQSKRLEVDIFKTTKAADARVKNLRLTGIPAQKVHIN